MGAVREFARKIYYALNQGRVVALTAPPAMKGAKWLADTRAGRSYQHGQYEPEITNLIMANLHPDSVFFDIGSHVGYFGLLASTLSPLGAVHSFEPDAENYAFSQRIRQLNERNNWHINNVGVGERTETLFYQAGASTSTGQIADDDGEPMAIVSLDDYVAQHHIVRLDLLKLDVEGYGGYVVRGGINTLLQLRPVLIVELHSGTEEARVVAELLGETYCFFELSDQVINDITAKQYNHVIARPKI